ncbi:MAG: PqqD family peptide modification chaperone [Candidatus Hydrogenedens sp.]|nr:PqqD family peptide modification chaperone [Candidatus Hydrogenedens sp.]
MSSLRPAITPATGHGAPWVFPLQDHGVLMRPGAEWLYVLNPSALLLWQTFADTRSEAACVEALAECYGIDEDRARADTASTFAHWRGIGLLQDDASATGEPEPCMPEETGPAQHYRLGDAEFSVACAHTEFLADLAPRIAHCRSDASGPDATDYVVSESAGVWRVYRDGELLQAGESLFAARTILLADALHGAYAGDSWCASLHAAVIADGEHCVMLAGASGAGKSTLSVAAVLDGLECLGDDAAPMLQASGRVAAAPLGIMLREGSWDLFEALPGGHSLSDIYERDTGRVRFLTPQTQPRARSLPPMALLFIERGEGAAPERIRIGVIEALALLGQTGLWVCPEENAIRAWLGWMATLPCYRLRYDTAAEGVALVRETLRA